MDKDNVNSEFDFDNPEFSANFYKNIAKALGDQENANAANPAEDDADEEPKTTENIKDTIDIIENTDAKEELPDEAAAVQLPSQESAAAAEAAQALPEDIDDELSVINSSLAKQISSEMDSIGAEKAVQKKKWLFKIQSGIALTILCIFGICFFLGFTKPGNNLLLGMGINLGGTLWDAWTGDFKDNTDVKEDIDYVEDEDIEAEGEEVDTNTIVWPNHSGEGRQEEGVYNILLLGEESIGTSAGRGRTDVMVIATLNTNTKKILLTSVMRDTLVQIPGFKENKINVVFEEGGLDLLYETIAINFDLHLDGCVMVNFENFEKIIDELGGLEIPLTAGEAKYLNNTNYISNPANRNVKEGTHLMNGNQVLGYARVRKRANINGTNNDYGRTERHRIILNAVFEKYKTTSKTDLLSMMFKFVPMITTDIDKKNFEALLNAFVDMGTTEMNQLRIPVDGAFKDSVKVRGMSVLIPNLPANIEVLHSAIFGDESMDKAVN